MIHDPTRPFIALCFRCGREYHTLAEFHSDVCTGTMPTRKVDAFGMGYRGDIIDARRDDSCVPTITSVR